MHSGKTPAIPVGGESECSRRRVNIDSANEVAVMKTAYKYGACHSKMQEETLKQLISRWSLENSVAA